MVLLCIVFFILQCLYHVKHKPWNLRATRVLQHGEYYRLVTSAWMHRNCQHLAMNLIGTYLTGSELERDYGWRYLMKTTLFSMLSTPMMYVVLAHFHDAIAAEPFKATKGLSGVLFHWTTLQCYRNQGSKYDLFFVQVPAAWYPWALTAMLAAMDSRSSWLLHSCGILTGMLQYYIESKLSPINNTNMVEEGVEGESASTLTKSKAVDPASLREARLRKFEPNSKAEEEKNSLLQPNFMQVVGDLFAAVPGMFVSRSSQTNLVKDKDL